MASELPAAVKTAIRLFAHNLDTDSDQWADFWTPLEAALLAYGDACRAEGPKPIPCGERMPEDGTILAYGTALVGDNMDPVTGWHSCDYHPLLCGFLDHAGYDIEDVTHWLPIPPAPEREVKP
jgi:hypothetical protein